MLGDQVMTEIMRALNEDLQDPGNQRDWEKGEDFYYQLEDALAVLSLKNGTFGVKIIGVQKLAVKTDIFMESD